MSVTRRITFLLALLAGLTVLGACGSSSPKATDTGSGTTSTTTAGDTTSSDTSATGTDTTGDDTGDAPTTAAGSDTDVPVAGPEAGTPFCKDFKALITDEEVAQAFDDTAGDTATQLRKIKTAYQKVAGRFDDLAGSAPGDIHDEFQALNATYQRANDQVQAVTAVNDIASLSGFEELASPEIEAHTKTISDYVSSHCGYDPETVAG